jgi:tight adherence protein C
VTLVPLLAAVAALLALAGARELIGSGGGKGTALWLSLGDRGGRAAAAALRLGLPGRLSRAGLDGRLPWPALLLAKLAGTAAGGLAALLAAPAAPGRIALLVAVGMPAAGFLVPDALLERAARRRHRRLIAALPDALDLLAVGAASGRGPASGFAEIARASEGPLADELRVAVAGVSCGEPLAGALRALRARVPGKEVAALCAAIERSRRFGSPLAEQLRRQSSALRRDQRRAVEERGARAAPKIQLVVALVLVPSVLLMIAAGLIANADALLSGF